MSVLNRIEARLRKHVVAVAAASERRPAMAIGAVALGSLALGALAIGAVAIGSLAVGKVAAKEVRIDRLVVGSIERARGGGARPPR
jgi:hypothetical protein